MTQDEIEALDKLAEKAVKGPYFLAGDEASDSPCHRNSGLALIDTGRTSDWPVLRLGEWHTTRFIAALLNAWPALKAMALRTVEAERALADDKEEYNTPYIARLEHEKKHTEARLSALEKAGKELVRQCDISSGRLTPETLRTRVQANLARKAALENFRSALSGQPDPVPGFEHNWNGRFYEFPGSASGQPEQTKEKEMDHLTNAASGERPEQEGAAVALRMVDDWWTLSIADFTSKWRNQIRGDESATQAVYRTVKTARAQPEQGSAVERDAGRELKRIAEEAFKEWDSGRDSRVGKILMALAGLRPGYRADIDAIHAALAQPEGKP